MEHLLQAYIDPSVGLVHHESRLRAAFPDLNWRDETDSSIRVWFSGESRDIPCSTQIHLARKEPPGPYWLTIRARAATAAAAEQRCIEIRDYVLRTLETRLTEPHGS